MSPIIRNPILPGFHPDPSICRVGEDYYLANSTFEWFPGVWIHHSRDLQHWRLSGGALKDTSLLDLRGCEHSCGIWAPCLTHADGLFWLIYTNVRSFGGPVTDTPNYLVTAGNIEGPWSEPVYLHSRGFDASLFHDTDGRKYVLSMQLAEAGAMLRFDGIIMQEYDHAARRLVGPVRKLWNGTARAWTEGPHIYKRDGYYYLLTAEGGTSLRHAVSMARSREIWGPFEECPSNPILTSHLKPQAVLQSAGHACLVDTPAGEWAMVHLCNRPLQRPGLPTTDDEANKSCPLGRETAIQKIEWPAGDWPRLADGGNTPRECVEFSSTQPHPWPAEKLRDDFDDPSLSLPFQTLREPPDSNWLSLTRRPGWLSLRGRNSLTSVFDQSLVARRLQHMRATAETCISFRPEDYKQAAGLIAYYDRLNYLYLRVTSAGEGRIKVGVVSSENNRAPGNNRISRFEGEELPLVAAERLFLRMSICRDEMRFYWSLDGQSWKQIEQVFDSTMLGDWASEISKFTGTFWGICCQDVATQSVWADFDYFDYRPE